MRGWRSCGVVAVVCSSWLAACGSSENFFQDSDAGAGGDAAAGALPTAGRSGGHPAGGSASGAGNRGGDESGGESDDGGDANGGTDTGGSSGSGGTIAGNGGSLGGMGGTIAGNGGSGGTIAGSGGMGGKAGSAGMGGTIAGSGGSAAGSGGMGGKAGSGGSGGAAAGSGGSGGSGGSAAGSGGSPSGGAGGNTGTPGKLSIAQSQLSFPLTCPTATQFTPQAVILKNTGGSELTWTSSFNTLYLEVTPSTSTLAPGAQVSVTVSPKLSSFSPPTPTTSLTYPISVTTNVPGDAAQSISVVESTNGYFVTPPANIAFGDVPVGMSVTKSIAVPFGYPGPALGCCSSPDFVTNGVAPLGNGTWSLTFTPSVAGPASVTLTLGAFPGCLFPPNTFTASGKGI